MGDRSAEAKDLEDEGDEDVVSEVGRGLGIPVKSHDEDIVLAVAVNWSLFYHYSKIRGSLHHYGPYSAGNR